MIPVILSGGSGSRLWPLSRGSYPKQFHPLVDKKTLLQNSLTRVIKNSEQPIIICNQEHRFIVAEQVREIALTPAAILLEPLGRNTAPAVTIASLLAAEKDENATLLIMPADHHIPNIESFNKTVELAELQAAEGKIVTLGITPTEPLTGYGYIEAVADGETENLTVYNVNSFTEKPDAKLAEQYLASGKYLWNSGIFIFKASVILNEMQKLQPEIFEACKTAYKNGDKQKDFYWLGKDFEKVTDISIDYAVMEKTDKLVVVKTDMEWSDVGAWGSIHEHTKHDENGNSLVGDVLAEDTQGCYIRSEKRLVAAVGVKDLVIVETPDAILVANKHKSEEVKKIAELLKKSDRAEWQNHKKVHRPWGFYDSINSSEGYQVKHIMVSVGAKLSHQLHYHRAEHWVVVKGTASVTCGDEQFILTRDQSTYIPLGTKHRIENIGKIPLELIEVQSGNYLGEDDIVRFEDEYDRAGK